MHPILPPFYISHLRFRLNIKYSHSEIKQIKVFFIVIAFLQDCNNLTITTLVGNIITF